MIYAIFSDIHGNLGALEAVTNDMSTFSCDSIICLGDIVGYCSKPNECARLVEVFSDIVLSGNHDYAAIGKLDTQYFNLFAKQAMDWTIERLDERTVQLLKRSPLVHRTEHLTAVHATPGEPEQWKYLMTFDDANNAFEDFATQICFIGHSHVPMVISRSDNGTIEVGMQPVTHLEPDKRYIINVGSVGQPRDRDPRACYITYDTEKCVVEIRRVDYDIPAVQESMRDEGLPEVLIQRLAEGW